MSIVLLLSRQRSGTGALASVMERHPDISYAGEVLDPTSEQRSFYGWLIDRHLDTRSSIDLAARFLEFVEELKAESQINLVDIKYNCLSSVTPAFHSFSDTPWILQVLSMIPVPMIHLRRSPLECYISSKIAENSNTFHTTEEFDFSEKIDIDFSDFKEYLRISYREDRFFGNFFAEYNFYTPIDYEDMMNAEGHIDDAVISDLSRLLSLDFSGIDTKPRFVRQAPASLANKINNLPEVTAWFGKYGAFLV